MCIPGGTYLVTRPTTPHPSLAGFIPTGDTGERFLDKLRRYMHSHANRER